MGVLSGWRRIWRQFPCATDVALAIGALIAAGCTPTDPTSRTVICGGLGLVCCVPAASPLDGGVLDSDEVHGVTPQARLDGGAITGACDPGLWCSPEEPGSPPRCEPCPTGVACEDACVDLSTDRSNCGACGVVCGGGTVCTAGACMASCITGQTICTEEGIEICRDLSMDVDNCGTCGSVCPAGTTCFGGTCAATCGVGLTTCAGGCVDLLNDHANCGMCGMVCPDVQVCGNGSCVPICAPPLVTCLRSSAPYCAYTSIDPANCGSCGNVCAQANAVNACVAGQCVIAQCAQGFSGCGQMATNGCNVDLTTSSTNCGGCGNTCAAGLVCVGGTCAPPTWQPSCPFASELGCGQVSIPGGTFTMGGDAPSTNGAPVAGSMTLSAFRLDAYEVTVARFRRFMTAGYPVPSNVTTYPGGSTEWGGPIPLNGPLVAEGCTWSTAPGAWEAHPINGVDWWTAQAFCVWDGGRLPTETEWEYAARGTSLDGLAPGRIYPWGNADPIASCGMEFDPRAVSQALFNNCPGEDDTVTTRVGRFAPSAGLYDLAGNVAEWTADWYRSYTDAACWSGEARSDPICASSGGSPAQRVLRGSSWTDNIIALRSASRHFLGPNYGAAYLGFRCARSGP